MSLHLRHEVHHYHNHDQQGGATEIERYLEVQDHEFRQQTH